MQEYKICINYKKLMINKYNNTCSKHDKLMTNIKRVWKNSNWSRFCKKKNVK